MSAAETSARVKTIGEGESIMLVLGRRNLERLNGITHCLLKYDVLPFLLQNSPLSLNNGFYSIADFLAAHMTSHPRDLAESSAHKNPIFYYLLPTLGV